MTMRKKFIASLTSLVLAFVMLTSASFAWFTISKTAEVKNIEVTVEATKNLEIAKASDSSTKPNEVNLGDAGNESAWGSKITEFTGAKINFPATYASGTGLKTIGYDENGRVLAEASMTTISIASPTLVNGEGNITASVTNGPSGVKVAAIYGVWLRSNQALNDVKLTASMTNVTTSPTDVAVASGTSLTDIAKVIAVVNGQQYQSGDTFSLTANEATLVYILIYVDGDKTTAATFEKDFEIKGINVTFSSATLDSDT